MREPLRASGRDLDLNGEWRLSFGPQTRPVAELSGPVPPADFMTVPAQVPGNVELDLIRAGLLPDDLAYGENAYELRALEGHQWWYQRTFELPEAMPGNPVLVFDGIDTLATIWLNGERLGTADNMLVPFDFPLGECLRQGSNTLVIAIDSAVLEGRRRGADAGSYAPNGNWEALHIRKAPHMYGWDIMPRVVSAGLWRDVRIEFRPAVRFNDVYLATSKVDVDARRAELSLRWNIVDSRPEFSSTYPVRLRVTDPRDGRVVFETFDICMGTHSRRVETLDGVDMWWPKGYGAPTLYDVELAVIEEGTPVATWQSRFGFRTVDLRSSEVMTPDGDGEFQFVVNGVDIFCKGSNWVPVDALHSRDAERLDDSLTLMSDLNCNMIRCWGGNVYESDAFFDFCDQEGVLVWQDFALACAMYPQTAEFHDKIRREAEIIVPRLRNHPCLALWAGNNEIDQHYPWAKPGVDPNVDDLISRQLLPEVCRSHDPWRAYLPSSPYYSPKLWASGNLRMAVEDHLWGPREDFKQSYYADSTARFASETGYHGCPARSTLERIIRPEQLWPWQGSQDWLTHAMRPQPEGTRYDYRIPLMATQIEVLFGAVPGDLDSYILASQISQSEALKFLIEKFRIDKGDRSGILWWNIKDGWPEISDALVDYYGARKLAYDIVHRLQRDVLVMAGEPDEGHHRLVAVNETAADVAIDVNVTQDGASVFSTVANVIPANGRLTLGQLPACSETTLYEIAWHGPGVSGENHYMAGPRPFDLNKMIGVYRRLLGDAPVDAQIASASMHKA